MENEIFAFETTWLANLWCPDSIIGDDSLNNYQLKMFSSDSGSGYKALSPRCHSKMSPSLNKTSSEVYIVHFKMQFAIRNPYVSKSLIAQHVVRCSNELYGSNTLSAYEMEKRFTRSVSKNIFPISHELIKSQQIFPAKLNLSQILSSQYVTVVHVSAGDLLEIHIDKGY